MSESTEAAERWRSGQRPRSGRPRSREQRRARKMGRAVPPPIDAAALKEQNTLTDAAREIGRQGVASLRQVLARAGRTEE